MINPIILDPYKKLDHRVIQSSLDSDHNIFSESAMPLIIDYKQEASQYGEYFYAEYYFEKLLYLNFIKNEKITIDLKLTIETKEKKVTNSYKIKYYPYLDKGSKIVPFTV